MLNNIVDVEIDKKVFADLLGNHPELMIMDIGTYDGKDSLEFRQLFPQSKIYAFEADPRSAKLFKKIVSDDQNITLVQTALSNIDGKIDWYASDSDTRRHYDFQNDWSASNSIKKPDNHISVFDDVSFTKTDQISSMRLDTWMTQNEINNYIDVMWVDVNGGELEFIEGAIQTLVNRVKYLYIEFNGVGDKTLYKDCPTVENIKGHLKGFRELGIYNFKGNFGNVLLKNEKLK